MRTIDFTKIQAAQLEDFANASDKLFELGVITTDSFTGEIGEYIACKYFHLTKMHKVARAIDGICSKGYKYQIKAKVVSNDNFNYNITNLYSREFNFLAVVYFDKSYNPLKILKIPSTKIKGTTFRITVSDITTYNCDITNLRLPSKVRTAINRFAKAYEQLEENKIIRSRRIVGDIGEFYACRRLNLHLCTNRNEKGYDADNKQGLRFEIKTRRVYESGRRSSKTRRINNLVGKDADYLIVVTIDRAFRCSGMWIMPMRNIINPKSAHLGIVNTTLGVKNLIPSKIDWLQTGEKFKSF